MAAHRANKHPDITDFDVRMLARAVQLARRGQGYAEPNPMVGCVIVQGSRVIGEGWHRRFGGPHAEVWAMRDAVKRETPHGAVSCETSRDASRKPTSHGTASRRPSPNSKPNATLPRGCTVYVTLEPCCDHPGKKTPPCVDALIEAKVTRVVIAALDPNPHVRGKSVRRLRDAGIHVDVLEQHPNRDSKQPRDRAFQSRAREEAVMGDRFSTGHLTGRKPVPHSSRKRAANHSSHPQMPSTTRGGPSRTAPNTARLARTAHQLIAPFATFTSAKRPYVIAKWAQSIDGKLATASGDSRWISCEKSRRVVHRLRARVDAILVGVNTVLIDDPLLTARDVLLRRIAARVVLDTQLRTPIGCQLVRTAHDAPLWIMTSRQAAKSTKADRLRKLGAEVIPCRTTKKHVSPTDMLHQLHDRNVMNLMVEGGPTVLTTFLHEDLVDEAMIFVAPLLIGGQSSPGPCNLPLTVSNANTNRSTVDRRFSEPPAQAGVHSTDNTTRSTVNRRFSEPPAQAGVGSMISAVRFSHAQVTRCGSDQLYTLRFSMNPTARKKSIRAARG